MYLGIPRADWPTRIVPRTKTVVILNFRVEIPTLTQCGYDFAESTEIGENDHSDSEIEPTTASGTRWINPRFAMLSIVPRKILHLFTSRFSCCMQTFSYIT